VFHALKVADYLSIYHIFNCYQRHQIGAQQQAWVVERLGRFQLSLKAGLNFIVPFIDTIAYKHPLKEDAFDIPSQTAITRDNVTLVVDGILYIKITDPKQASYWCT
jgi:regulator of protease activity HflC (stomatin/prohibitin superfamily)